MDEINNDAEFDFEEINEEEMDNIVVLNDEDGNPNQFEFLDIIELDGEQYVVLLPLDDEESGEVVILQIDDSEDEEEETYIGINDEETLNKVFAVFKEKFKDEFNFEEE